MTGANQIGHRMPSPRPSTGYGLRRYTFTLLFFIFLLHSIHINIHFILYIDYLSFNLYSPACIDHLDHRSSKDRLFLSGIFHLTSPSSGNLTMSTANPWPSSLAA
jgi:hypothetical protein